MKEFIILSLQAFVFYIFPLFAGPTDIMGLVVIILLSTILFGILMGIISTKKMKYIYPIINAMLFIPSIFIYYNESAFIHSLWYLISSCIGLLIGVFIKKKMGGLKCK